MLKYNVFHNLDATDIKRLRPETKKIPGIGIFLLQFTIQLNLYALELWLQVHP